MVQGGPSVQGGLRPGARDPGTYESQVSELKGTKPALFQVDCVIVCRRPRRL